MKPLKIALITFSDPRYTDDPDEREEFTRSSHNQLKAFIDSNGFQSIDPHAEVERKNSYNFGFDGNDVVKKAVDHINEKKADILILECYQ